MRPGLEEAIALLKKGDAASIDQAFQLLQRTVVSFGIKVCGHREDAEDTAQEVLVKALPHLAKLEDPHALSAWLYTAAKNRCWQGRRTASYQRTIALEQLLPDDGELQALLLADPGSSPEEDALLGQDRRLLHEAVLTLPPQYRMVLVLHDMEELDTDLVAKILSIQPGTVRVRLHRARLLVRQAMAKLLERKTSAPRRKKKAVKQPAQCREIFANLSEYLDGKLEPESCERMRHHIEACPACVAFIQDLKRAIDRCQSLDVCPDKEANPILRRLLTEEYLRLKNSAPAL
ncbi:MAG: sigma-70 family RNA polymerase sigma factor [Acidobacteriota bacterium]